MDLNKVMLIGRSTSTLQVKMIESTQSAVVNFTIATNRKYKNKEGNILEDAEYHRCVAYGNTAELLWKYLTKGKKSILKEDWEQENDKILKVMIGFLQKLLLIILFFWILKLQVLTRLVWMRFQTLMMRFLFKIIESS